MGLVGDSNGSTNEDDYAVELMDGKRKIIERGLKDRRNRSTEETGPHYINGRLHTKESLCTKECTQSFRRTIKMSKMRTNFCEAWPGIPFRPDVLPKAKAEESFRCVAKGRGAF